MNDTKETDKNENGEQSDSLPDTSGGDWITITDVKVVQSRITVPKRSRERYDIGGRGQVLDVVIHPADTDKEHIFVEETRVGGQHRILFPKHRIELNGLEGEYVDIEVRDTGLVYGGD